MPLADYGVRSEVAHICVSEIFIQFPNQPKGDAEALGAEIVDLVTVVGPKISSIK